MKHGGQWKTDPDLWEKLKPLARCNRHNQTTAEEILWGQLRNRGISGFRFRRQHTVGRYIVDFYCAEKQLVIEVDGPIHDQQTDSDAVREEFLVSQRLRVLRFKNDDVIFQLHKVIDEIAQALSR